MLWLVVVACSVLTYQTSALDCGFTAPDGSSFDLTSLKLSGSDSYSGEDSYFRYKLNMCAPLAESQCQGSSICAFWKDDGQFHSTFGSFSGTPAPTWSLLDTTKPGAGVALTFKNGQSQCGGGIEAAKVVVECDPAVTKPTTFSVSEDFSSCVITITMASKAGCPASSSGGGAGGLSGGWVFIILLIVLSFVYVVGGCVYNRKQKGTVGMSESCPHIDFWRSIPGLVKDGCSFTWAKIQACTGRGGNYTSFEG